MIDGRSIIKERSWTTSHINKLFNYLFVGLRSGQIYRRFICAYNATYLFIRLVYFDASRLGAMAILMRWRRSCFLELHKSWLRMAELERRRRACEFASGCSPLDMASAHEENGIGY